jgi:hypothetical protein
LLAGWLDRIATDSRSAAGNTTTINGQINTFTGGERAGEAGDSGLAYSLMYPYH